MSSKKVTKTKDGLERKENGASPAPVASTSNLKNKGNLNMINLFVNLMEIPFFFPLTAILKRKSHQPPQPMEIDDDHSDSHSG